MKATSVIGTIDVLWFFIVVYVLFFRYVIHTVGPRYNVKYQTAADSALYFCYRNSMLIVR
jgi:O-acetyl-ADP-ribose deacetylase (regulator of RNase III)